ncbi:glucose-1-phosphate adenylyltransferase [Anaerovorax odorimutans]|uniref:Glucose-1-phosphate adenylyltransferase n=1 Tax=Anaerovorax odorimutans TaxID=109327 RepID=A0ABT1RSY2_9FIRM|nr:glucose-1-phosphate adenylyltransferase [Anaerovorax odorimutans]MCQ4638316.1 glucose-1-phosphate adenylyltransferase [Anaerovorax odorimutans]
MRKQECVAMLLAGGQGSRLGALTRNIAKPAVAFGGKYRIIDFSLSNCTNSNIHTVGVLTQYKPLLLNSYIGTGAAWDLDDAYGGVFVLPPYATEAGGQWYQGTADAIFQNVDFIDSYDPQYVLVISGDHLYKMDYSLMLDFHKQTGADLTISVMEVAWEDAGRFGILTADRDGRISKFAEKPSCPDSNLASMGIYVFNWNVLKEALIKDSFDTQSDHDFGKNVIPMLLGEGKKLYAYTFTGYWQDVGTIDSYYNTNMELLDPDSQFNIFEEDMRIFSNSNIYPPHYIGHGAAVENSLICNGSRVLGDVKSSILSFDVSIEEGASVADSILLPGASVKKGAQVFRSIVGENSTVAANSVLGNRKGREITVIGDNELAGNRQKGGAHE